MANDLDRIMDMDPLLLSSQDIDEIIAYERKARHNFEAGIKPKKEASPKGKVNLDAVMSALAPSAPAAPTIKRRM